MRIVHVSPEVVPYAKTGGLADVVGALPRALADRGHDLAVFMPGYRRALRKAPEVRSTGIDVTIPLGDSHARGSILETRLPGTAIQVYLLANDGFYDREDLYGGPSGDYPDNAARFVFFSRAVLEALPRLGAPPAILHCHDWQSALVPVYLKTLRASVEAMRGIRTVLTIHNLAYQGLFWHWDMKLAGLPWELFQWRQLEFWGKMNFLKGGIVFADALTTVSPRYGQEIQTPEFGCGLDGVLAERAGTLRGILNGADTADWNPEADPLIPSSFSSKNLRGKGVCKAALRKKLRLTNSSEPLFGMIGRLVDQKGVDLLAECFPALMDREVQLVILGKGEERYQRIFEEYAKRYGHLAAVHIGFDNRLAHLVQAGSDVLLMPSRYEPCGLNQLHAMRYGTVPIVRETGGLADTVVDCTPQTLKAGTATGFVFRNPSARELLGAVDRARALFRDRRAWQRLMRIDMGQDWSWERSAAAYDGLYADLQAGTPGGEPVEGGEGPGGRRVIT